MGTKYMGKKLVSKPDVDNSLKKYFYNLFNQSYNGYFKKLVSHMKWRTEIYTVWNL